MYFKDHFSGHAGLYSRYRPCYPTALYRFLSEAVDEHELAWDCATGNGQAALGLAPYFKQVIATDASSTQLEQAFSAATVEYRIATAEKSDIAGSTVDLVSVAQALHWFDLDAFHQEVRRVLKPGGILAVWNYNMLQCTPAIDAVLADLYESVVGRYWPPERRLIENNYRDLPFPYEEQLAPSFTMKTTWDLHQLYGYLQTWSAVQRYKQATGKDPLQQVAKELDQSWGEPEQTRTLYWPLSLRWGRKP